MCGLFSTTKKRKPFKTSTKKMEWMSVAGRNPLQWRTNFVKTSKCRQCGIILRWGDRRYAFDHKDNNSTNNSQSNCYLVCRNCHGHATVIKKRKTSSLFGSRYKTIKKKVGYKKPKKKKSTTKKRKTKKR